MTKNKTETTPMQPVTSSFSALCMPGDPSTGWKLLLAGQLMEDPVPKVQTWGHLKMQSCLMLFELVLALIFELLKIWKSFLSGLSLCQLLSKGLTKSVVRSEFRFLFAGPQGRRFRSCKPLILADRNCKTEETMGQQKYGCKPHPCLVHFQ